MELASGRVFFSKQFTVPKKDSPRGQLIIDLSPLNTFIQPLRCQIVTVTQVQLHLSEGVCLTALDLQDPY